MRFYRSLRPIAALTFDLDDTLYDNHPVIAQAEQALLAYLQQHHPELHPFDAGSLRQARNQVQRQQPELQHDVSLSRFHGLQLLLQQAGYSDDRAVTAAHDALVFFNGWRNRIRIPDETHHTLAALAQRFPLVAITNGNADLQACGLGHYFRFALRAGPDGRSKPYPDMYLKASEQLNLPTHSLLHVGDHLTTDVAGGVRAGVQTCWINTDDRCLMRDLDSRLLPHIEISRLASLLSLL